jgi:uncharacterized protein (DUF1501 family)
MERRLQDIIPTRRDVLKWGGIALAGSWVERVVWPLQARAAGKANPRGTARHCIMIELAGAMNQAACFDFKEMKWTPKDLEPQKLTADITLSKTLFPRLGDHIGKIALTRATKASEVVHFTGQYHTQTGRAMNIALSREIPAFGSLIASELDGRRKESDTFPAYVSASLTTARAGSIGSGFLPVRFTGLDLDPTTVFETFSGNNDGLNSVLEERWRLLEQFAKVSEAERNSLGKNAADYQSFYNEARKLRFDPKWVQTFKTNADEKKRYGEDKLGMGCIMARNLIAADAGTHFVYIYGGDNWDHHGKMLDHSARNNLYVQANSLDKALSSLLEDLSKMPGSKPGQTLLDDTIILATSEFGRTPEMNPGGGTDHYPNVYTQLWAGGGVKGGRALGKTDELAAKAIETGWNHKQQPWMDNAVATIYSALGIDWLKELTNTPSGRAYVYVQSAPVGSGGEFIAADEIGSLFG